MAETYKGRIIDSNYRSLKGGKHASRGHIKFLTGSRRDVPFESTLKLKSRQVVEFTLVDGMASIVKVATPSRKNTTRAVKSKF